MEPNVIAFTPRRAKPVVGALTPRYDPNGWLVITPEIYDWFIRNPEPATLVNQYGFLHSFTRRAFVCIVMTEGGFVCGMSNAPHSDADFDMLVLDSRIDDVISRLGFEPTTVQMTVIGVPMGTRLVRIERNADEHHWLVWTARSPDGSCGSYLVLHDDGMIVSITARADEGDESFIVKPQD